MRKLVAMLFCLIPTICFGWTMEWDANPPEEGVVKYRIYENGVPLVEVTGLSYVYGPQLPKDTCWHVTALNRFDHESGPSNEICTGTPGTPGGWRIVK